MSRGARIYWLFMWVIDWLILERLKPSTDQSFCNRRQRIIRSGLEAQQMGTAGTEQV